MIKRRVLSLIIGLLCLGGLLAVLNKPIQRFFYPVKYLEFVRAESDNSGLPIQLVLAVINTESGFNPTAESHLNARGLMQIREETFEWVQLRMNYYGDNYSDLFDPQINIKYGTWLLKILTTDFESYDNAILAYHAGWGSVNSWLKNPKYSSNGKDVDKVPFSDTAHYIDKVQTAWNKYDKLYDL